MPKWNTAPKPPKLDPDATYWTQRQNDLMFSIEKSEREFMQRLGREYAVEAQKLKKEIAGFYAQYGKDNVIEYRELLKAADPATRDMIYKEWEAFAAAHPEYAHLTPVREKIYRLNRLEAEQESIRLQVTKMSAWDGEQIMQHYVDVTRMSLDHSYEVLGGAYDRTTHIAFVGTDRVKPEALDYYLSQLKKGKDIMIPTSGPISLMEQRQKLADYMNTDLARGIARGDSYQRITKDLTERFNRVSQYDAYRIVYTEGTHIAAETAAFTLRPYFDWYEVVTANDSRVCDDCMEQQENGPFRFDERAEGINFPPMHPFCRCRVEPYVDDWDAWIDNYDKRKTAEMMGVKEIEGIFT